MANLNEALTERFTDPDEIKSVAEHGCIGGVSDFIYYHETAAFFDEHEVEICNFLTDREMDLGQLANGCETMHEIKNNAVWFVVEVWCQEKQEELTE